MTSTVAARRKLPVWPTVREAFASVLVNWQAVLRIFWAWIAILGGILVLLFQMFLRAAETHSSAYVLALFLTGLLLAALWTIGFASTAVAWHRLILLGDEPPPINLRIGRPVLRYLGRFLLICLTAVPIQLLCGLLFVYFVPLATLLPPPDSPAPPSAGYMLALSLVGLIISLPTILVVSRISISLPAIAVERPIGLEDAWQLTRGNSLQLCGGTLLIYAPVYMIGPALGLIFEPQPGSALAIAVYIGVTFASTVAAISFLSLGYRFFVRPHSETQT